MEMQETPTPAPRKSRLPYIIGGIVIVLLLAGAAFVGGRLLNGQGLRAQPSGGDSGPSLSGENGPVSIDFQPAKELPQTPADVSGLFDHRQDNSVFVGTGMAMVSVDTGGNVDSSHDGPTVEVVVTSQTKIYKDVTSRQFNGPPVEGQKIQQVLEEGALDEIDQASQVTAWGKKNGDRIIAEVLVYSHPGFNAK